MTDLSGLDTDSLLQAAGLTPNAHPVPQPPPGPDLSGMSNADLMKAAGPVSVPIPPPDNAGTGTNSPLPSGGNNVPTAFPGFQTGLADLYSGGVQFMLHALEATAPAGSDVEKLASKLRDAMDKKISDDEATYQKTRALTPDAQTAQQLSAISGKNVQALDTGRLAGNVVGAAPLAAAAPESLPGRIVAGAATGAVTAAAQPSTAQGSDFWLEKAKEAATGAAAGAIAAPIAGAAARVIKPQTSDAIQTLMDSGVKPTIGQLAGKATSRFEEGLSSMPLVGDAIKAGQRGAIEDFNRGTINQALQPIGESLGKDTPVGRQAINEAATKIGAAYDKLVPNLTAQVDPQFAQGMQNLATLAGNLPGDKAAQFKKLLTNEVLNKFSPNGTMTGETFKEVESTLGRVATDYSNSAIVDERYYGNAVRQAQDEMRQLLTRSNPDAAASLQANNTAYAMLKRVEGASVSSVKSEGVFTPSQLLMAIRAQDPSLGKGSFARGNALMQIYGEAGENILGSKVPDSGTALRFMATDPIQSLLLSPAALPAWVAHSPLGRKLAGLAFASRPGIAAPVASGVRNLGSVFGGAAAGEQTAQ